MDRPSPRTKSAGPAGGCGNAQQTLAGPSHRSMRPAAFHSKELRTKGLLSVPHHPPVPAETAASVVIRFAGDAGDGMQITENRFSEVAALMDNDVATFPDFPAEIRAPTGTTYGV